MAQRFASGRILVTLTSPLYRGGGPTHPTPPFLNQTLGEALARCDDLPALVGALARLSVNSFHLLDEGRAAAVGAGAIFEKNWK